MGTHAVDMLMWLLGDVELATGDLSTAATKYGETDDCGEALLKFKNGATGVAAAGWVCPFNTLRLEVVGTEGYAMYVADGSRDQLFFESRKVPGSSMKAPVPDNKMPKGLPSPLEQFLNAVTGQKGRAPSRARGRRAGERDGGHLYRRQDARVGQTAVAATASRRHTSCLERDLMKATLRLAAAMAAWGLVWSSPAASAADAQPAKAVIAFLGGGHTHNWSYCFYALNPNKDVRVKYVWDNNPALAIECRHWLADKPKIVGNVDEVFADPEVTGVMICGETCRHHDLVMAAAKAHKAIYVEKPMAITAKEAAEMADAIDKAGVFFTTGYHMRSDPKFRFLKEQVAKGDFGRITRMLAENCNGAGINHTFDPPFNRWMADAKQAGGGGFCDMGTHALDMAMWLGGDVESATGDLSVVVHNYGDTDDCGEALLKFKNAPPASLSAVGSTR